MQKSSRHIKSIDLDKPSAATYKMDLFRRMAASWFLKAAEKDKLLVAPRFLLGFC